MHYTQEMILHSDSGYCMPFEERNGEVTMSLGYGKQKHPHTGEPFSIMELTSRSRTTYFRQ